jgi:glyoxylase-like metal-dependent hydrolase (beta-lactamase superfamily II)
MTLQMASAPFIPRRALLADLGKGACAIAVVSLAGCGPNGQPALSAGPRGGEASPGGKASPGGSAGSPSPSGTSQPPGSAAGGAGVEWTRVNLGFVSAYVLVRNGEAAVVDTGVAGSADAIEASLTGIGLGWDAVGHVILTHRHPDHAGSAADVLDRTPDATGYAGVEDIPSITVPRPLTAVPDGDKVFDLTIVATPGHTAGHVCVLDPVARLLVAGDALNNKSGLAGSSPQNTDDPVAAMASVIKLAGLSFDTVLFGHGEPIEGGASEEVAKLAASLG